MFANITLVVLNLLDTVKPRDIPRVEEYITDRVPMLVLTEDIPAKIRKPRKSRSRHVCTWTDQEVWGAVIAVFIIGLFIGHCL